MLRVKYQLEYITSLPAQMITSERWMKIEAICKSCALISNWFVQMDKASIVGDAVCYVQKLQMQAKKLKAEIVGLESSLNRPNNCPGGSFLNAKKPNFTINPSLTKKILQVHLRDHLWTRANQLFDSIKRINTGFWCILIYDSYVQMEMFQVEERKFYVRMVSNMGQGIAPLLYKALESLASFKVHSSNLAAAAETYIFTFTMNVSFLSDEQSSTPLQIIHNELNPPQLVYFSVKTG